MYHCLKSVKPLKCILKKTEVTEHTAVPQTTSSQSVGGGPYMGTRSRPRDHQAVASESVEFQDSKGKTPKLKSQKRKDSKTYCLCNQGNPKGLMVLCKECRDWFHPKYVGISDKEARTMPIFVCSECLPGA